MAIIYYF